MPGDEIEDDFTPDDLVLLSDGEDDVQLHAKSGLESQDSVKEIDAEARIAKKRNRKEKEQGRAAKVCNNKVWLWNMWVSFQKRKHAAIEEVAELVSTTGKHVKTVSEIESFLNSRMSLALSELTPIELDEHRIPTHSIADTANWLGVRTLDNLSYFISEGV